MSQYTEELDGVIGLLDLSQGQKKELEGLFEELPGELEGTLWHNVQHTVMEEVTERLESTTVDKLEGLNISVFIAMAVARKILRIWSSENNE